MKGDTVNSNAMYMVDIEICMPVEMICLWYAYEHISKFILLRIIYSYKLKIDSNMEK